MFPTVVRSTARGSITRTGYVCISCRANHQLTKAISPHANTIPPLSTIQSSDDAPIAVTPGHQGPLDKAVVKRDKFRAACQAAKIKPPAITIEGSRRTGWTAKLDLVGVTHETKAWPGADIAIAKAKAWAIRQIRQFGTQSQEQDQQAPIAHTASASEESQMSTDGKPKQERDDRSGQKTSKTREMSIMRTRKVVPINISPTALRIHERDRRVLAARAMWRRGSKADPSHNVDEAPNTEHAEEAGEPDKKTRSSTRRRERQLKRRSPPRLFRRVSAKRITYVTSERSTVPSDSTVLDSKPVTHTPISEQRADAPRKKPKENLQSKVGAKTIQPLMLEQISLDVPTQGVPSLSYGLDRVLFNSGVYNVQDPRSRVYNFDPYLEKIIDPSHFNFAVLDEFRSPSADNTLSSVAEEHKVQYFSSTSAITPVLVHLHFLLSNWRPLSFDNLSVGFLTKRGHGDAESAAQGDFTRYSKSPQSIYLKPKQGGYAIDRAEDKASAGLLSFVGQCLEKLFTVPKEVFEMYKKDSKTKPEAMTNGYHYTKFDSVLVRSQLDAHDDRLPGTGIFDIKTRAVLPIRMDSLETSQDIGKGYEIRKQHGEFESYEREFHDMARATMLKYSLQARLGRMDGIFVAYHNIARLFGFQYLSLADMDKVLHGQTDTTLGDAELSSSLRILSDVFDLAVEKFPNEPIRLYFDTRKRPNDLIVCVVPVKAEEIERQHEDAQRVSREYLTRLNKLEEQDEELDEKEAEALVADAPDSSSLEGSACDTSETNDLSTGEKAPEKVASLSEGENWLNVSAETPEDGQESSASGDIGRDEISDELSRLTSIAREISMETNFLSSNSITRPKEKVHKLMLKDIARKTFAWEKDIQKLDILIRSNIGGTSEQDRKDLAGLVEQLEEQKKVNDELYAKAEDTSVITGREIKDFTNAQTLEEVLKASVKRYDMPSRMAAFKVKVQSRIDGEIITNPPTKINKDSDWDVTYTIEGVENTNDINALYTKILKRQDEAAMNKWHSKKLREFYEGGFFKNLMSVSKQSRQWRKERDRLDEGRKVVVFEPKG